MNRSLVIVIWLGIMAACLIRSNSCNEPIGRDQIYAQIFLRGRATPVDPLDTYKLLRRLNEIEVRSAVKQRITALLEMGDIQVTKCDLDSFHKIIQGYSMNFPKSSTLESFVNYCAKSQFLACRDKFSDQLQQSIRKLSKQDRILLETLDKIFIEPQGKSISKEINEPSFERDFGKSLLKFFRKINNPQSINGFATALFGDHYIVVTQLKYINELCERVELATEDAMSHYIISGLETPLTQSYDDYALEWIPRLHLCYKFRREIKTDQQRLVRSALRTYN